MHKAKAMGQTQAMRKGKQWVKRKQMRKAKAIGQTQAMRKAQANA